MAAAEGSDRLLYMIRVIVLQVPRENSKFLFSLKQASLIMLMLERGDEYLSSFHI